MPARPEERRSDRAAHRADRVGAPPDHDDSAALHATGGHTRRPHRHDESRSIYADYAGAHRRHVRADDLVRRFDEIRRDERLDVSAAELPRDAYV